MARYVQDVVLNKPDDFVYFMMNDYLQKNSYTQSDWKGEPAYRTGDAFLEGYKYLKWSYANGIFHLEAWMKGSFGKEMGLTGFVATAQKTPYRKSLEELVLNLQQEIPQPNMGMDQNGNIPNGAPTIIPVKTADNSSAATWGLVLGILSIVFALFSPLISIICAAVGITRARMGLASSKGSMARAGRVCCIVGCCLAFAMWILNIFLSMPSILGGI